MDTTKPPPFPATAPEPLNPAWRTRWWIHLNLLLAYPLVIGSISQRSGDDEGKLLKGPMLPTDTAGLLALSFFEMLLFGVLFTVAWLCSRAGKSQLLLRWNDGWKAAAWGLVYSIGLRVGVGIVLVAVMMVVMLVKGSTPESLEGLRPQTEHVVDATALVNDPVYFALSLTLISFVVAGFREELWRAGVLAGLIALFPERFGGTGGRLMAVGIAALVFGLGHFGQGWGGVLATAVLGFGLGAIMVRHRSIWEAVLAHGFFNATTFAMLYFIAKYQPHLLPGGG